MSSETKPEEPKVEEVKKEEEKKEEEKKEEEKKEEKKEEEKVGKSEKKVRKALSKLGMIKVEGVNRVTMKQKDNYIL